MKNTLIAVFAILLLPLSLQALELELDSKSLFDANFTIDSTFTLDGKTSQLSASGKAGPTDAFIFPMSLPASKIWLIEASSLDMRGLKTVKISLPRLCRGFI